MGHWQHALVELRKQEAAEFGRRAHARFGRGVVLLDGTGETPIYVTRLDGAPFEVLLETQHYEPEREAVIVYQDDGNPDVVIMGRIKIAARQ